MVNSRWGNAFHEFRTNRNISLKQIADDSVSIAQISRFERGESDMSYHFFFLFDMRRLASSVTGTASTDMRAAAPVLSPLFLFSLLFSVFWLM